MRQYHLFRAATPKPPLVIAYGLGVDSTAMLIGLQHRGIRPDLILFADTGGEKPETYFYAPIIRQWLRDVAFPQFEVVRYAPPIAPYDSLFGNCWQNETLPSLGVWPQELLAQMETRTAGPPRSPLVARA